MCMQKASLILRLRLLTMLNIFFVTVLIILDLFSSAYSIYEITYPIIILKVFIQSNLYS